MVGKVPDAGSSYKVPLDARKVISANDELLLDVFCIVALVPIVYSSCTPISVPVDAGNCVSL